MMLPVFGFDLGCNLRCDFLASRFSRPAESITGNCPPVVPVTIAFKEFEWHRRFSIILITSASVKRIFLPEPTQAPKALASSLMERSDQPVDSASSLGLTVLGMMLTDPDFRLGLSGMRRDFSRAGIVAVRNQRVNAAGTM